MLVKNSSIALPNSLLPKALESEHENHWGTARTKRYLSLLPNHKRGH